MRHNKVSLPTPKEARAKAGISQRELAKMVPTTQGTVNRVEQLGRYPRQGALRKAYLAALGLVEEQADAAAGSQPTAQPAAPSPATLPSRWSRALTGARS